MVYQLSGHKVGRITTAGIITELPLPQGFANASPFGTIIEGPDGAVWFPMSSGSTMAIGRMATNGAVTSFVIDTTGLLTVGGLTVGNDGAIYLAPVLNPMGHWAGYLFPALTGKRGTIDCSANLAVAATALRFIGTNAFSSLPVIDKKLASSLIPGVALPHFAVQDIWTTGVVAINTNTTAANFSIAFYDDNGNPISLPFSGGATNTLSGTLAAQGSAYFEASNPKADLISGWASVAADQGVVIQALYRENASGKYFEAAVPAGTGSAEFEIPFDATTFSARAISSSQDSRSRIWIRRMRRPSPAQRATIPARRFRMHSRLRRVLRSFVR